MFYYAIVQNGTYIVAGVIYITPGTYTPPSGYTLELADPSVQDGYIYNPSTGTYAPPPPTVEQLQVECQNQVASLMATLTCGSYTVDPTTIDWGTIIPKINEENSTDNRVIVDTGHNYQTVTNAQLLATYVVYADLLQLGDKVTQSVYADIASNTTTTLAQVDSSVTTYAASVSARTSLASVRSLIAGLVPQTTTINGHALSSNVTLSIPSVYNGTTLVSNPKTFTASATVASGVAVFYLTADGTSTGTALFPTGPITSSLNWFVNSASTLYLANPVWSNSNKTLTLTVNSASSTGTISLLGLNLLGSPTAAANGVTVNISVSGY